MVLKLTLPPRWMPFSWLVSAGLFAGAIAGAVTATQALAGKDETTRFEKIATVLVERGVSAMEKNQLDEARQLWEEAVIANPRNATAFSYLGLVAQRAADTGLAKKYFGLALDIDPNELHALSWGGQADLSSADLEGAQAKLQRLSRLCGPGCAEYKLLSDSVGSYKSKSSAN
jgi:tetratricopeptide (TPR) repeat protein